MPDVILTTITEKDLDMLLLEELASNPAFARWFAEQCRISDLVGEQVLSVSRGVTTSSGESDIKVSLLQPNESVHCLLIENKINAALQPRQAKRYRDRGESYKREEECSAYTTILVAPQHYLGDQPERYEFDCYISYEAIKEWLKEHSSDDPRSAVKEVVLSRAIEKSNLGYVPAGHQPVTEFWRSYWTTCTELAPELEMPEPGPKPSGAGFVQFRPPALPTNIKLLHKLPHGNVDLQFSRMGKTLSDLRGRFESRLQPGMAIKQANKSGVIRIKVPPLDTTIAFDAQRDAACEGMEATRRLLKWYSSLPS